MLGPSVWFDECPIKSHIEVCSLLEMLWTFNRCGLTGGHSVNGKMPSEGIWGSWCSSLLDYMGRH